MVSPGDTAWVLTSAALVMLMTPGLAFFYGGMVRSKSVLNMLMLNFVCLGIVGILWALYGFSLAFGNDVGGAGLSATCSSRDSPTPSASSPGSPARETGPCRGPARTRSPFSPSACSS